MDQYWSLPLKQSPLKGSTQVQLQLTFQKLDVSELQRYAINYDRKNITVQLIYLPL